MKILWLCNIILPDFCGEYDIRKTVIGGWMTGLFHQLEIRDDIALGFCFPIHNPSKMKDGLFKSHKYYSFHSDEAALLVSEEMVSRFVDIINDFEPDIVHIWGTEYFHSSAMLQACERLSVVNRMVVSIQGLVSEIARYYSVGVPEEYLSMAKCGFCTINSERDSLAVRGEFEKTFLRNVRHIIGKTDWVEAYVTQINPYAEYYHCEESLRDTFYKYTASWNVKTCERNSIFISQAHYPLKGLHFVLMALPTILKSYPDTHVYVSGVSPMYVYEHGIKPYGKYIADLIEQFGLLERVSFIGPLSEESMAERYYKSHVFISASSVENMPNSVCEAMLIGTPVVASYVGGISNSLTDKISWFLYQQDAVYMLSYYVCRLFADDALASSVAQNASKQMAKIVDRRIIVADIANIYRKIICT